MNSKKLVKILGIVNIILAVVLVYIIINPVIRAKKVQYVKIYYVKNLGSLPIFVAKEKGIFDKYRLKVEFVEVKEASFDSLFKSKADVIAGVPWHSVVAKNLAKLEKIKVISGCEVLESPISALVSFDKKIKRLSDFNGKMIGYVNYSGIGEEGAREKLILKAVLSDYGIKNAILWPKEDNKSLEQDLKNKQINSVIVFSPWRERLLSSDNITFYVDTFIEKQIGMPYFYSGIYTTKFQLMLKKEAVKRFVFAINEAIDSIKKNYTLANKVASRYFEWNWDIELPTYRKWNELDKFNLMKVIDYMRKKEISLLPVKIEEVLFKKDDLR